MAEFVYCSTLRAPLIITFLSTVKSPASDKSVVSILAFGCPIKILPPIDKSFDTNNLCLTVASSSTNALF